MKTFVTFDTASACKSNDYTKHTSFKTFTLIHLQFRKLQDSLASFPMGYMGRIRAQCNSLSTHKLNLLELKTIKTNSAWLLQAWRSVLERRFNNGLDRKVVGSIPSLGWLFVLRFSIN